jgi:hypothetical protein
MEQKVRCIYRKKKCFHLCNKTTIRNTFYCCYHIHSKKKHLCKIFFKLFEERSELKLNDIYTIYKYIVDSTEQSDDVFINILFIDLLKMIPAGKLSNIYKNYINKDSITKNELYNQIYLLNYKTHTFNNKCNVNNLIEFQNIAKYKMLCVREGVNDNFLNDDDLFTTASITDIHPTRLFTIKDAKGTYGFDIVELEYFVRKCLVDNVAPYNPYTRETLDEKIIWRLNMKLKYHNIAKKKDECIWTTDMNAYTDLSIEIEKRGFYNNPEWFKNMSRTDFLKCIKLFRDFSSNVEESKKYLINISEDRFTYDFCEESIKLFNECNDDLYILCCNYMKSLALCSNEFYNNIPDWLSTYETPSYISNVNNFASFISTLISNDFTSDSSERHSNLMDIDMNMGMNNDMNMSNLGVNLTTPIINPSNNFLLYYYVEYM